MFSFIENKLRSLLHVDNFNHTSRNCLYFILIMNVISSAMVTIFIPGFSSAAADLQAAQSAMQLTVVVHLLGEIIGRLLWGPLCDYIGKKHGLIPAVTVSIIGQLGCCLSQSVEMLIVMRFIQAVGSGVVYVVSLNFIASNFDGVAKSKAYSTLEMYQPIANLTAPILGSILCTIGGWRFIFFFLFVAQTIVRFMLSLYMPNDKPIAMKSSILLGLLRDYRSVMKNKKFVIYAIIPGFVVGGYMVYSAHAPEIYQYSIAPGGQFSESFFIALIQSVPLVFNIISTSIYRKVVQKSGLIISRRIGTAFNVVFMLFLALLAENIITFSCTSIIIAMCIHSVCSAFLVPISVTRAMECSNEKAGILAASIVVFRNSIMSICISLGAVFPGIQALICELLLVSIFVLLLLFIRRFVPDR